MIRYRGCIFAALALALCFGCVRSAADVSAVSPSAVPVTEAPTPAPTEEPTPTPSPTTTPSPTPTPTPEPTPEPITEERLQSCEFDFFFDDAVFVGDSVTRTFNNYANARRKTEEGFLGEARFMGAVAMSVMNASSNRAYPGGITFTVRGKPVSVTEGLNLLEAKRRSFYSAETTSASAAGTRSRGTMRGSSISSTSNAPIRRSSCRACSL